MGQSGKDGPETITEGVTVSSLSSEPYAGRYRIERELGRGGMGRVVRALDLKLGRAVALKVLSPGNRDEQRRLRFEQEARAAGALDHPNILAVHDIGEHEGEPYIVTELLEGETLRAAIARGPLPPAEAQEIAAQLASALAAAHAKGIVHRDLKPDNLFLTREGRLKVLDFGIAKLLEAPAPAGDAAVHTAAGALMGTPGYMSPEQITGQPADARSDIFSCGVVFHEMLCGRAPFARPSTLETAFAILHDTTPGLPQGTPEPLARVVARCLEKDPRARYANGSELRADLRQGHPSTPYPRTLPARGEPAPAPRRPTRWRAALPAAGIAVLLAASALIYSRTRGAGQGPASIAVLPFADMSPGRDQEYFSDGLAEEILNSLAQIEGLRVAGRTSSFSFKGKNEDLRSIGQKLGVDHVLEGSVRKQGDRVRITTQLIQVSDGFHLWSQAYDRGLTDVFAVQDEIGRAVAQALKVKLLQHRAAPEVSPEAYNELLLGRKFHNLGSMDGARRAAEAFRKAVRLAPGYAPAWSSLAFARFNWAYFFAETGADFRAASDEAFAAAEKAIALDPAFAKGYSARGHLRSAFRYDWAGAQADFERALSLSPGDTGALGGVAGVLASLGRLKEAIAAEGKLAELDPLAARVFGILGYLHQAVGEYELSGKAFDRALEIAPDLADAPFGLATNALLQARPREALDLYAKTSLDYLRLTGQASAQQDLGRRRESDEALRALIDRFSGVAAYQIAQVHAWRREPDDAFAWLDRAFNQRDPGITYVKYDPLLRNLRGDRRWPGFLKKMNLPAD
ncbi:MAG TPA: protein kinase [Myxococcales bacterium]|nr:protein kinase [Myxococcales bacterium]